MKAAQALILALVVSALLALPLAASAGAGEGYMFYVFADSRCPHCKSLIEFFRERGYSHSVCYVDLSTACNALFADLLKAAGLPGLVPVTVAVANGSVGAIVVGALRDAEFWDMARAGRAGGEDIPIYMPAGDRAVKAGSVPAQREAEVLSLLTRFPVGGQAGATGPATEVQATQAGEPEEHGSDLLLVGAVLAFLAGALAYILLVEGGVLRRIPGR